MMIEQNEDKYERGSIQSLINQIDITKLNTESWGYEVEIELLGQDIGVDISFEKDTMKPSEFQTLKTFLNNLEAQEKKNRNLIDIDYRKNGYSSVRQYLDSYINDNPVCIEDLIDKKDDRKTKDRKVLKGLQLHSISINPEEKERYSVWDYTLGSDSLLVLYIDEKGELIMVTSES